MGNIGNSLGEKGIKEPNQRRLKLTEFISFFNLCSESFEIVCWRYRSTLDYVFLRNCLLDNILMVKTFDLDIENTSDHVPIQLNVSYLSGLLKEQD